MATTVLYEFGDNEPLDLTKINANFSYVISAVNSLAGDALLQLGAAPGGDGTVVPVSGGAFLGQISAPSIMVGPPQSQNLVVTFGDVADTANAGIVRMADTVADSAGAVGGAYSQAEVQAILDELRALKAAMKAAGLLNV